ncbi:hypothetical protein HMN09_00714300 [Mycena chlorophos]|uniref:Methyltransferase domain-containing protein n=1 Tax=Mycena chlorophos TaxID=658473 RepID=A0A8H6WDQ4_MYCCL|nr:hypothetical protein HMN09_00714300 [Mycena chlorophos]
MKLSASYGLLVDLFSAIWIATLPTLKAIFKQPTLILQPVAVSRIFMAAVWNAFAGPTDEGARPAKAGLIKYARGTLLDIGAGLGHSIPYLDREQVTAYVALEPNALMHDALRERAAARGYTEQDGSFLLLRGCGAEDTAEIRAQLAGAGLKIDTMLSILTFCSIPRPQETLAALVDEVLEPGGQLLFYEHVLNPLPDVARVQRFWTPIWRLAFDGCAMDRPTHLWIDQLQDGDQSVWAERTLWGKEGEPAEHLWWHQVGRFVRR